MSFHLYVRVFHIVQILYKELLQNEVYHVNLMAEWSNVNTPGHYGV